MGKKKSTKPGALAALESVGADSEANELIDVVGLTPGALNQRQKKEIKMAKEAEKKQLQSAGKANKKEVEALIKNAQARLTARHAAEKAAIEAPAEEEVGGFDMEAMQLEMASAKKKSGPMVSECACCDHDEGASHGGDHGHNAVPAAEAPGPEEDGEGVAPIEEEEDGWSKVGSKAGVGAGGGVTEESGGPHFSLGMAASCDHEGPLHHARLEKVVEILKEHKSKKVLDLGCGEGRLLTRLRDKATFVTRCAGVDVDHAALSVARANTEPQEGVNPRPQPLAMELLRGNLSSAAAGAVPISLIGWDAIACVETVEHLDPEPLADLPAALLGALRPKIAIVTTPNVEFNVVWGLTPGELRHWDHRFEWNRSEFRSWAEDAATKHGYRVHFTGVGEPHDDSHGDIGQASQFAVFERLPGDAPPPRGIIPLGELAPWELVWGGTIHDMETEQGQTQGGGAQSGAKQHKKGKGKR